jgi:branched-chain amino acid transport system substrate-binding protein
MKYNRLLRFAFVGVLIISLVSACRSSGDFVQSPTVTSSNPATTLPQTKVIKIGAILPLTGQNASLGEGQRLGMKLAIEKSDPGKSKIEAVFEDSQGKPEIGVSASRKLLNFQDVGIQVLSTSNVAKAVLPIYKQSGKELLVMVQATAPDITKEYPFSYRIYQSATQEVNLLTDYAQKKKYLKVGMLHFKNRAGEEAAKAFGKNMDAFGGKLVAVESFTPENKDLRPMIQKLKAANIDALMIYSLPTYYQIISTQAEEAQLNVPILANSSVAISKFEGESPAFLKKVVFPATRFYLEKDSPDIKEFTDLVKANGGKPTEDVAYFYDMTKLLVKAVQSANSQKISDIQSKISELTPYSGLTGKISFNQFRDAQPPMKLSRFGDKGIEIVQ